MKNAFYEFGKHALLVEPSNLRNIDEQLSSLLRGKYAYNDESSTTHTWRALYDDHTEKRDLTIGELLAAPNRNENRIVSIQARSEMGYPTVSLRLKNWGDHWWECEASLEEGEAELDLFKRKIVSEMKEMRPWYSMLALADLSMILPAAFLFYSLLSLNVDQVAQNWSEMGNSSFGERLGILAFLILLASMAMWLISIFEKLKTRYLFPKFEVVTDGGIKRHDSAKTLRLWLFTPGMLIAGVSVVVGLITS